MTERERLIRLLCKVECNGADRRNGGCPFRQDELCNRIDKLEMCMVECLADHLLANGVIVPPCKVGDILFVLSQMKDKRVLPFINEYEATSIAIGKRKCVVYHQLDGFIKIFKQDDFGKTVFLTREEAEKALAERSNDGKS